MAAAFPMEIFLSLERHKFNRGIKENTETARPIKIKIKVKPVKLQDISLITPTVAIMPKANAGADVDCNRKENCFKAVSNTVWICWKAVTTEKPIKEK